MMSMKQDDLTGSTLSHYRIIRKLGSGGMGTVYLAEDKKLDRTIALKILPSELSDNEDRMRRFVREAKAASAIDHPNIVHVHEIGQSGGTHYIAMQYVDGMTLSKKIKEGPLKIEELLDSAIQITDALTEAHARKIVHRDLKPANIMISSKGSVKLLDFGLARIDRDVGPDGSDLTTQTGTMPGAVLGTAAYMSPEQSLGSRADHRTDIFSLGVVLYEMTTAKHPFFGKNPSETVDRIVHAQPEPVARFNYETPQELERIIRKCLEKNPDHRYQSAAEILVDLKNLKRDIITSPEESLKVSSGTRAHPASRSKKYLVPVSVAILIAAIGGFLLMRQQARSGGAINTLAVLPFKNVNLNPESEYLSDGITDSIISNLSRLTRLRVMSRGTVFAYKNKDVDPRQVGRQLGVDGVVAGKLLQQDGVLIVTVDFMDARDGRQIWGDQYKRSIDDLVLLQSEISREISENLRLQLSRDDQKVVSGNYTVNPEAYQLYLQGHYLISKRTLQDMQNAIPFFEQAIHKDPEFALAYNGLANCYAYLGITGGLMGGLPPNQVMPKARDAVIKALELDDTLSDPHVTLAHIRVNYDFDWQGAEREYKRALELNPNNAQGRLLYSLFLAGTGRKEEARSSIELLKKIDPGTVPTMVFPVGIAYYWLHDYDTAIEHFERAIQMEHSSPQPHFWRGLSYLEKGDYEKAIAALDTAVQITHRSPVALTGLGIAYAKEGKMEESKKILSEVLDKSRDRYIAPFYVACLFSSQGNKDEAFRYLNKAYEERANGMAIIKAMPMLDPLRSDPRFNDLLSRLNLL
jgi:serine/threonine-protein kinase